MAAAVTVSSHDRGSEPSVFVAAWLLAELPPDAACAITTGPAWVRFELGSVARDAVVEWLRTALRQPRFDGWDLDPHESDPPELP